MLRALVRCVASEGGAQVICSTTHKAKGREWEYVQVDSDFLSAASPSDKRHRKESLAAEMRLLYVAITRAKHAVSLPKLILERFDLRLTTAKTLGATEAAAPNMEQQASGDPALSGVVSPYHSPKEGESREMATLRRILRR